MCYCFGLSPNVLPLAQMLPRGHSPGLWLWAVGLWSVLVMWVERLLSLSFNLSLSLSSLARPKSLSLISLSSPMDLPLFLGNLSRYLQWVVVKATASVAECCEGLGFLCEVFLCELVFGASRSCVVELCGVDFCGKRLISSQIQRCSLGLVSG